MGSFIPCIVSAFSAVVSSVVKRDQIGRRCGFAGEAFDETPRKRSRLETAMVVASWAGLPSDILGLVLGLLPCFAYRTSVGAVCRHCRSVGRSNILLGLHPPLLVLVLLRFRL